MDDDKTAQLLLDKGQLKRKYTILPLNKLNVHAVDDRTVQRAKSLVRFIYIKDPYSFNFKGVMTQSMVDALLKLCSPFLKGGNCIHCSDSGWSFSKKRNIGHSNNYSPNRNKMGSNY